MSFIEANPNPVKKLTGDCVIRAIAIAENMRWEDVYAGLTLMGLEMGDWGNSNPVWGTYLKRKGYRRYGIPTSCPDCYTVKDFCNDSRHGTFILSTGTHVIAVIDGNYYDTWDSGEEVPVYYWKKKENIDDAELQ